MSRRRCVDQCTADGIIAKQYQCDLTLIYATGLRPETAHGCAALSATVAPRRHRALADSGLSFRSLT
jgi:hypothetical protein